MIHIRTLDGECICIENEVWITANRNGTVVTPHRVKAKGVGDGTSIWSLGGLEGFPEARIVTRAEYEEQTVEPGADPELSAEEALAVMMGGSYEAE